LNEVPWLRKLWGCAASAFTKCYAQVWDVVTGQPIGPALKHDDGILHAAFSPDGTRLVTASEDFSAIAWDLDSGKAPLTLKHEDQVWSACFSSDGKLVLTAGADKVARIWSANTGDPLGPPLIHPSALSSAKFLKDGRTVVTSDRHGSHWIWTVPIEQRSTDELLTFLRLLCLRSASPTEFRVSERSFSLQRLCDTSRPNDARTAYDAAEQ
jgi:WD40 repeat protein